MNDFRGAFTIYTYSTIYCLTAKKVYKIKNKKTLNLWSPHSIRVGACVLLQAAGKNSDFIQQRLRWLSDAYKVYLRNLPQLAQQHNTIVTNASAVAVRAT